MVTFEKDRVTVTSALPYIHGVPHLGNAAGSVLPADIFHRYLDVRGVKNVFICGSDVHGTPLELEAMERGIEPEELKQEQHEKVRKAYEDLNMDFSIYGDTDSEYNRRQTHEMFEELYINGHIHEKEQVMPYCRDDQRFLPDRYIEGECPHCGGLARGDQCDDCGKLVDPDDLNELECQICSGNNIEFRETRHLFLDLEPFKQDLMEWFSQDPAPVPDNMTEQVENDIRNAEERAITRDQDWGFRVPVERVNSRIEEEGAEVPKLDPGVYDDKVLYVWFDAPIGYIGFTRELFEDSTKSEDSARSSGTESSTSGDEWIEHWCGDDTEVYYSIGKDNTIFHTVIWPSMLMGSSTEDKDYNLPHYEFIQQYLMWEDQAFSKSRNVGIWIDEATELYPADYWRFYLGKKLPQNHDTNFSWEEFEDEINNVLNDTVGNFVNRVLTLADDWFSGEVPVGELERADEETIQEAEAAVEEYAEAFENHDLKEGLDSALELARIGDRYLSDEEPWNNESRRSEVIHTCLQIIRGLAVTLYPYTPDVSHKIAGMLDTDIHTEEGVDELMDPLAGGLEPGHELGEREILFEKIDVTKDREEAGMINDGEEEDPEGLKMAGEVSVEEFEDLDLRVGRVTDVKDHPDADKLYVVKVDAGDRQLQTCAGLKEHYTEEELEGRTVVVLANLEEADLRGKKSECMMLAAEDDDGNVSLIAPDKEMDAGSEVK